MANSRIPAKFIIDDNEVIEGQLLRFLAPRTIDALLKKKVLEGRGFKTYGVLYFGIPLSMGNEKPSQEISRGLIAYWPKPSAICIFIDETRFNDKVTKLGVIYENYLNRIKEMGEGLRIKMILG